MRSLALTLAMLLLTPLVPLGGATHETPYATCQTLTGKDVVLVIDRSSSMLDQGRMPAAINAANALLGTLSPSLDQSALVSFSTGFSLNKGLNFNHAQTQTAVNALVANGATSLGGAIRLARFEFDNGLPSPAPGAPYSGNARPLADRVMIVLSDGDQTIHHADPVWEAHYAKNARDITIFSIALGTSISPAGLAVMADVASSPGHFYVSPDPADLVTIFQQISAKLNDQASPSVLITRPSLVPGSFAFDASIGPSQYPGVSTVVGPFTAGASAGDDCLVDRVEFALQLPTGTLALGSDHTAPFEAALDCDALPAGRVTIVATAYDWLGKSATASRDVLCVKAHVDARATALYMRVTNPADPTVATRGAQLPPTLPGAATHDVLTMAALSPIAYELSALHDEAQGALPLPGGRHLAADALSRIVNLSLPSLGWRIDAIESRASAQADADPFADPMSAGTPFAVMSQGSSTLLRTGHANLDALIAATSVFCTRIS